MGHVCILNYQSVLLRKHILTYITKAIAINYLSYTYIYNKLLPYRQNMIPSSGKGNGQSIFIRVFYYN